MRYALPTPGNIGRWRAIGTQDLFHFIVFERIEHAELVRSKRLGMRLCSRRCRMSRPRFAGVSRTLRFALWFRHGFLLAHFAIMAQGFADRLTDIKRGPFYCEPATLAFGVCRRREHAAASVHDGLGSGQFLILLKGRDGIGGVHQRRTTAHVDGHAQRFLDLLAARA